MDEKRFCYEDADCKPCKERGLICIEERCVQDQRILSSDCLLQNGGFRMIETDGNISETLCECVYPEFYGGKSCQEKNIFYKATGSDIVEFDALIAPPSSVNLKCNAPYTQLVRIPNTDRFYCVSENVNWKLFQN